MAAKGITLIYPNDENKRDSVTIKNISFQEKIGDLKATAMVLLKEKYSDEFKAKIRYDSGKLHH